MANKPDRRSYLSSDDIEAMAEAHVSHPLNAASDVYLKRLGPILGLQRLALHIARVPPGKESFVYHRHERDEEFMVILSGRGRAEIGDAIFEIGPGDVMGFTAPNGPAHHIANPFDEDLIYLMGGESSTLDVAHYPRDDSKMIFSESGIYLFKASQTESLSLSDWLVDSKRD